MEQLGFIGLGSIGYHMVNNLLKVGNQVMIAYRKSSDTLEELRYIST